MKFPYPIKIAPLFKLVPYEALFLGLKRESNENFPGTFFSLLEPWTLFIFPCISMGQIFILAGPFFHTTIRGGQSTRRTCIAQ